MGGMMQIVNMVDCDEYNQDLDAMDTKDDLVQLSQKRSSSSSSSSVTLMPRKSRMVRIPLELRRLGTPAGPPSVASSSSCSSSIDDSKRRITRSMTESVQPPSSLSTSTPLPIPVTVPKEYKQSSCLRHVIAPFEKVLYIPNSDHHCVLNVTYWDGSNRIGHLPVQLKPDEYEYGLRQLRYDLINELFIDPAMSLAIGAVDRDDIPSSKWYQNEHNIFLRLTHSGSWLTDNTNAIGLYQDGCSHQSQEEKKLNIICLDLVYLSNVSDCIGSPLPYEYYYTNENRRPKWGASVYIYSPRQWGDEQYIVYNTKTDINCTIEKLKEHILDILDVHPNQRKGPPHQLAIYSDVPGSDKKKQIMWYNSQAVAVLWTMDVISIHVEYNGLCASIKEIIVKHPYIKCYGYDK